MKTNSRTIRSRLSQPSSLHDTVTVNLTLVQCVFHTGKNKLPLQELNQSIGIKMPTLDFPEIFAS